MAHNWSPPSLERPQHAPRDIGCFGRQVRTLVHHPPWVMAKECFTTNDLALSFRPTLIAVHTLCYNGAMFSFAPYGPYWQELRDADVKEADGRRFLEALKEWVHLLGTFIVGDALPFLRFLDLGGHENKMKKIAKELDSVLDEWLEEHRRKRTSHPIGEGDQDFIHVMLSFLDGSKLEGYDADTVIKATALALIAGGVDTTSVTLTWAMSCLLNHPHVLKEAQKELEMQVGKERGVKESDIRKAGGYHVTKGTQLITNLWKIQTDPRIWCDPLEFKPERFLTTHKDIDMRGQHFEFTPFGSGRRICAGISFGLQAIHLSLATFLHCFHFSKPSDEPIDMTQVFRFTTKKATPLKLFIKPRLSTKFFHAL
ncbi:cytochrome P450 82A4-like [Senna tora]|uniref:Cytochrome P450 82A4-like n=1 Tax=Senna tora TaxID=362788 RepID=A0A834TWD9_9FABA|nr:cytochrome P450 82A4-like [Senna tora]